MMLGTYLSEHEKEIVVHQDATSINDHVFFFADIKVAGGGPYRL